MKIRICVTESSKVLVKFQKRIFGPLPPYRIDFAKNRKKSESTQNGLKPREIKKKVVQNHLKREKNSIFFYFFQL